MQNKHYQTIHHRKKRGKGERKTRDSIILKKAERMFNNISKEKFVKGLAKSFDDVSIRIDLVGTPEAFFIIANKKGRLKFIKERIHTDMAVGIHKEYFLELLKNPPQFGNMNFIHNNIIFRKGIVKMFKYARPLLSNTLLNNYKPKGVR